ncbi:MAG: helix-turn-helix transcriptional regulator [Alistipes sp.]|nr:helix-turn-helix transcriptional regulator [Alistipes sp.]
MYKIDLQTFIKKNKLTQKGLAKILGVGQPFISQVIKGKSHLSTEKIEALLMAGIYDTSMIVEASADDIASDTVTMSREVFNSIQQLVDTINSQQRTIESQQRMIENSKGGSVQVEEDVANADVG